MTSSTCTTTSANTEIFATSNNFIGTKVDTEQDELQVAQLDLLRIKQAFKDAKVHREEREVDYYLFCMHAPLSESKAQAAKEQLLRAKEHYSSVKKELKVAEQTVDTLSYKMLKIASAPFFHGPDNVTKYIFTCMTTPEDYKALSLTCKYSLTFSKSITPSDFAVSLVRGSIPSSITIKRYKKRVSFLNAIFPQIGLIKIETALRQALKLKHTNAFAALKSVYAEKAGYEIELKELQFSYGKGVYDIACKNLHLALDELQNATAQENLFRVFVQDSDKPSPSQSRQLELAKDLRVLMEKKCSKAKELLSNLQERKKQLTILTNQNIEEGYTSKVCKAMEHFYAELNEEITSENEKTRFIAMRCNIG